MVIREEGLAAGLAGKVQARLPQAAVTQLVVMRARVWLEATTRTTLQVRLIAAPCSI
jgi:hypothetical protein